MRSATMIAVLVLLAPTAAGADPFKEAVDSVADEAEGVAVREPVRDAPLLDAETVTVRKGNWLAAPVPFSNPTVGSGIGAGALYLHPKGEGESESTSAIAGMATDRGSWMLGGFTDQSLAADRFRLRVIAGAGELERQFFGIGRDPLLGDAPLDYTLDAAALVSRFLTRLGEGPWYAGVQYEVIASEATLDGPIPLPSGAPLQDGVGDVLNAGLGFVTTMDARDSGYYPTEGSLFYLEAMDYGDPWGGDRSYRQFEAYYNRYLPLRDDLVLALRGRGQAASGQVLFYDYPYLDVRGVSKDRYRDDFTLSAHAELRWSFSARWGMVGFVDLGWLGDDPGDAFDQGEIWSAGGGIRWQVTRERDLNLGLDLAITSEGDEAFYLAIGESF